MISNIFTDFALFDLHFYFLCRNNLKAVSSWPITLKTVIS